MPRPHFIAALAAVTLIAGLVAGCAPAPSGGGAASTSSTVQTATPQAGGPSSAEATPSAVVRMTTSKGVVTIALNGSKAPITVANFLKLVKARFYDGILIHRVEPGFVVQAGDPLTRGLGAKRLREVLARQQAGAPAAGDPPIGGGGPGWTIPLEKNDLTHERGVIAMARTSEPDSAGSQFYITLAPAHPLDGQYAVFGAVTDGMDVVDRLAVGDVIRSIKVIGK